MSGNSLKTVGLLPEGRFFRGSRVCTIAESALAVVFQEVSPRLRSHFGGLFGTAQSFRISLKLGAQS
jgi:hypothetical protein